MGNRGNRPLKHFAAGHSHFFRSAIALFTLCFACSISQADTVFQVSVGSYTELDNARKALERANSTLGSGHQVLRAQTQRGEVYRVLSRPYTSKQDAQRAVAVAKRNNISGAWIVSSQRVKTEPRESRATTPQVTRSTAVQQTSSRPAPSNTVALNGSKGVPVTLSENSSSNTSSMPSAFEKPQRPMRASR